MMQEAAAAGLLGKPLTAKNVEDMLNNLGLPAEFATHSQVRAGGDGACCAAASCEHHHAHVLGGPRWVACVAATMPQCIDTAILFSGAVH